MAHRILVVEDEQNLADSIVSGLREEGYIVEHAADGLRGWECLDRESWDVVVLDWWLPGQDGLTLLRRFRERDQRTPVLFLTARDQIACRVQGLESGADDYLCKPFDFDELLARLRVLLRRRQSPAPNELSHGDICVDLIGRRATRAGRPLDLSAKELALLALFLSHPGEVLTRSRIYEIVWDESYEGLSKTLEVHVMELRRKLELAGPRVIHTVRGRGYVYSATPHVEAEQPA